ncbi:MAG TPA: DUF2807 domain-containing protein [Steroidobacter sp.]|uniref:GIN domain-containing protein n=1 Tax=Steroidobacter sp. TaxID=1978227 RepID=UPI002EDB6A3C
MKTYSLLGALTAATLLLSGCGDRGDHWTDKGPVVSERRDVDGFDSIKLEGATKLEITIGEPFSVQVNGHESAVNRVETKVDGDTLEIKGKARDWIVRDNSSRLTVQITLPKLESLQVEGGNDVSVVGFKGGDTKIKAAGAANLRADGQLDQLTVRMSGAGHADLSKLLVADAKVTVDGVGSVVVHPVESLDATMNGVGAIFYTGTPRRVNTRMNGLGTIAQRGVDEKSSAEPESDREPPPPIDPESLELEREDPKPEKVNHESGRIIVI